MKLIHSHYSAQLSVYGFSKLQQLYRNIFNPINKMEQAYNFSKPSFPSLKLCQKALQQSDEQLDTCSQSYLDPQEESIVEKNVHQMISSYDNTVNTESYHNYYDLLQPEMYAALSTSYPEEWKKINSNRKIAPRKISKSSTQDQAQYQEKAQSPDRSVLKNRKGGENVNRNSRHQKRTNERPFDKIKQLCIKAGSDADKDNRQLGNVFDEENEAMELRISMKMGEKERPDKENTNTYINCSSFLICSHIPVPVSQLQYSMYIDDYETAAENLDVLLFKNQNIMSKLQRLVTRSQYDHIGIVVQLSKRKYILESSGRNGVTLTDLPKFCQFIQKKKPEQSNQSSNQTGIAFRKFKYCNTSLEKNHILKKTNQFVQKVLGKKYRFSPMYLFSDNCEKKEETYFCSELVAECLKFCEVCFLERPSYSYLPKDFYRMEKSSSSYANVDDQQINADSSYARRDCLAESFEDLKLLKVRRNG